MLSIGKLTAGREDYYLTALAATADEYYLDPTETPGVWHGALAGRLGLSGRVDAEGFRAVLAGRHPHSGERLIPGADTPGRVTGFDLTFSAPKSVSVAWALSDPDIATAIAAAHDHAVVVALGALEAEAVTARRGHGGAERVWAEGLIAASFAHRTSRAGDPQLHTHLVAANLTVGIDGRWSAPDGRSIYAWAKTTGYLYQAALRQQLSENLGVAWGPVERGVAEIAGSTRAQRDLFSGRRNQITAEMNRLGVSSPRAAQIATLTTRAPKTAGADLDDLRAQWAARASAHTLDTTTPPGPHQPGPHSPGPHSPGSDSPGSDSPGSHSQGSRPGGSDMAGAVVSGRPVWATWRDVTADLLSDTGLTARATSFDRRAVIAAMAAAQPNGTSPWRVRAEATEFLERADVVALGAEPVTGRRYTTTGLLAVEARMVGDAQARRYAHLGIAEPGALAVALDTRPSLSAELKSLGVPGQPTN